jgi:hypothetical protein
LHAAEYPLEGEFLLRAEFLTGEILLIAECKGKNFPKEESSLTGDFLLEDESLLAGQFLGVEYPLFQANSSSGGIPFFRRTPRLAE